jgi:hypothetical protein
MPPKEMLNVTIELKKGILTKIIQSVFVQWFLLLFPIKVYLSCLRKSICYIIGTKKYRFTILELAAMLNLNKSNI